MSPKCMVRGLILPLLALFILPLAASWFAYPDTHLPPGFGVFPPAFVQEPPGFNPVVFSVLLFIEVAIALFLLLPRRFGFKPTQSVPMPARKRLPFWFWIGAALMTFFWWLMWARMTPFGDLVYYAFTPLWWGFILMLDGLVYYRRGGYSLLSSNTHVFAISALFSVVGWFFFEYYNYFALGTWYYPYVGEGVLELNHETIAIIFLVAYSTVWPAIFEWYTLLNTYPKLVSRYSNGPKVALSGNFLMWGGFVLVVAMVFLPHPLFWVVWVGPLAIFAGMLIRVGIWTPFTTLAQGNWTPMILMALAALFTGFFWEMWNFGSAHPALPITNPNYWMYDIPYVNVIHIFSDMPLLGYFGYLPFGIMAWLMFICAGKVFGFNTQLLDSEPK
jgi:hypothetical protein